MPNLLFSVSITCLLILLLSVILKKLNQPYLIAYVFAGILLGPHIAGVFSAADNISAIGDLGILLLMFFLGIEINIPGNKTLLIKSFIAQTVRTLLSITFSILIGKWLDWNAGSIFLLAITFIFNSTAVVSEFLKKNDELSTPIGKTVLNILLLQDIMLAPVLTFFQFMNNVEFNIIKMVSSLISCVLIFLLLRAIRNKNLIQLKFFKEMETDHELQVFTAVAICLGFALITSFAGLTPSIGSFIAGVYIGSTNAFQWFENVLRPFKIFFVALFFLSVGVMLDLRYVWEHFQTIIILSFGVLLINGMLSVIVFRAMKFSWRESMYAGTLLSQTGEFGLLACSLAYQLNIIDYNFFKSALAVIGLSLLLSSVWITILRNFIYIRNWSESTK